MKLVPGTIVVITKKIPGFRYISVGENGIYCRRSDFDDPYPHQIEIGHSLFWYKRDEFEVIGEL